jgi:hypothetical protein
MQEHQIAARRGPCRFYINPVSSTSRKQVSIKISIKRRAIPLRLRDAPNLMLLAWDQKVREQINVKTVVLISAFYLAFLDFYNTLFTFESNSNCL